MKNLLSDFDRFSLRIKHFFKNKLLPPKHPFKGKSDWTPLLSSNPTLEQYITLTKTSLSTLSIPPTYPNLSKQELKNLHSLSKNKGNCIVVEDTTNYIHNGVSHLQDASIYRQLLGDLTEHMSESIGHFIDDLYSQNYIDRQTHLFLKPPNTPRTQRLYF